MATIRCGHCGSTHLSVEEVRACSQGNPITTSVYSGGEWLSGEAFLDGSPKKHEHCQGTHNTDADRERCETLPTRVAQAEARREFRQNFIEPMQRERTSRPTDPGFYQLDGDIYKVQIAVHGSQMPYAKRLELYPLLPEEMTEEQRAAWPGQEFRKGTWVYAPGVARKLRQEDKLTQEQAKALGKLYGCCVRCGRTLTKESSIEQGMGDICAGKSF